jgi:hypothetical protein
LNRGLCLTRLGPKSPAFPAALCEGFANASDS